MSALGATKLSLALKIKAMHESINGYMKCSLNCLLNSLSSRETNSVLPYICISEWENYAATILNFQTNSLLLLLIKSPSIVAADGSSATSLSSIFLVKTIQFSNLSLLFKKGHKLSLFVMYMILFTRNNIWLARSEVWVTRCWIS